MRLNRFLARTGIASRRKADELIRSGDVFVNEKKTTEMGFKLKSTDEVRVKNQKINLPNLVYYALHKPVGVTCTRKDKYNSHNIFNYLPDDNTLYSVGRLDKETSGLILVTNDGDFGQKIIHPKNKIEKEYLVTTQSPISKESLTMLVQGVRLDDGTAWAKVAKKIDKYTFSIIIEEGRNRIVRRMVQSLGNKVAALERVRIGEVLLDIKVGEYRKLREDEIKKYV